MCAPHSTAARDSGYTRCACGRPRRARAGMARSRPGRAAGHRQSRGHGVTQHHSFAPSKTTCGTKYWNQARPFPYCRRASPRQTRSLRLTRSVRSRRQLFHLPVHLPPASTRPRCSNHLCAHLTTYPGVLRRSLPHRKLARAMVSLLLRSCF